MNIHTLLLAIGLTFIAYAAEQDDLKLEIKNNTYSFCLEGHSDSISGIAISSCKQYIVTCSQDTTAKIWDRQTGKLLHILNHMWPVKTIIISNDGYYIITCSTAEIKIWNCSGECLSTIQSQSMPLRAIAISRDNKFIAAVSRSEAMIYDITSGACLHKLKTSTGNDNTSITIDPEATSIVIGSADGTAKIWDIKTGKNICTLRCHTAPVSSVAMSADGNYIFTASHDKTAKIWGKKTGQHLRTLPGHTKPIISLVISPDDTLIITGSQDGTAKIWCRKTGKCLLTLQGHTQPISSITISADSSFIATGSEDKTVKIWDIQQPKEQFEQRSFHAFPQELQDQILNDVSQSATTYAKYLLANKHAKKQVLTNTHITQVNSAFNWYLRKNNLIMLNLKEHTKPITSLSISKDNTFIVTGSADTTAKIWCTQTGQCLQTLQGHTDKIIEVDITDDQEYIMTVSRDRTMKAWHRISGNCIDTLDLSDNNNNLYIDKAKISPNHKYLVITTRNGHLYTMEAWSIETNRRLWTFNRSGLPSIKITKDSQYITTYYTSRNTVDVWHMETCQRVKLFKLGNLVLSASVSDDNEQVTACSSGPSTNTEIWKLDKLCKKIDHAKPISNRLAMTHYDKDKKASIIDLETDKVILNLYISPTYKKAIAIGISPDNTFLVILFSSHIMQIRNAKTGKLIFEPSDRFVISDDPMGKIDNCNLIVTNTGIFVIHNNLVQMVRLPSEAPKK